MTYGKVCCKKGILIKHFWLLVIEAHLWTLCLIGLSLLWTFLHKYKSRSWCCGRLSCHLWCCISYKHQFESWLLHFQTSFLPQKGVENGPSHIHWADSSTLPNFLVSAGHVVSCCGYLENDSINGSVSLSGSPSLYVTLSSKIHTTLHNIL